MEISLICFPPFCWSRLWWYFLIRVTILVFHRGKDGVIQVSRRRNMFLFISSLYLVWASLMQPCRISEQQVFWLKIWWQCRHFTQIGLLDLPDTWMAPHKQNRQMLCFSSIPYVTLEYMATVGMNWEETPEGLCRPEHGHRHWGGW